MSETPPPASSTPSEPVTGPIATPPPMNVGPYPPYARKPSRLNQAAAWVGITAGVVFIVAVIFSTGFMLGAHSGGHHRGGGHDRGGAMEHRQGPPSMFPMGPMLRPGPGFVFPGGPGGNMGPGDQGQGPSSMTPTPPR